MSTDREGWFKSSFSANGSSCVEVRFRPGRIVAVRDTKDRSGPVLEFTSAEWVAFLAGVAAGEFDLI
jgi:hypothetical protein